MKKSVYFVAFVFMGGRAMRLNIQRAFRQLSHFSLRNNINPAVLDTNECYNNMTKNFITNIIDEDLRENRNDGRVLTRFPPEPNGYLHLGHAKSICLNFGISRMYGGKTNMRFDDTNPEKENMEYINSILEDVKWLVNAKNRAAPWDNEIKHASDYFELIYKSAVYLIENKLAYVDNLSQEEMRAYRGTLTEPGKDSPYRTRSIEENLDLFEQMRSGSFPDGHCVLRAKIDNTSPNINMRDPTLYRIKNAIHPITGKTWCIYPMYDFAHALSDAIEGITHSLCTLEFADHRPLYDWTIHNVISSGLLPFQKEKWRPTQIEFSRLNLQYTVLSKRKLIQLVTNKHVDGWADPRMPTISGLRRRGYPPNAIKLFCDRIGISRAENNIEMEVFEETMREYLDNDAPRIFALMNPLKVKITNLLPTNSNTNDNNNNDSSNEVMEMINIENHPKRPEYGRRDVCFSQELYIDRSDFFDTGIHHDILPPKGYKRLLPNNTVRLKYAYVITCHDVIRDPVTQEVIELLCTYDKDTAHGNPPIQSKKPKGIIQWVSGKQAVPIQMNLYDRLFMTSNPGADQPDGDFVKDLNPNSKTMIFNAMIEKNIVQYKYGSVFQFERLGYFYLDPISNHKTVNDNVIIKQDIAGSNNSNNDSNKLIFNRVVTLKDTWQQALLETDNSGSSSTAGVGGKSQQQQSSSSSSSSINSKYSNFYKLDIRVGKIIDVQNHPNAESLYVTRINCGDTAGPRTVISGLVKYFTPQELLGKKVIVLCNLKPSKLRGLLSEAMILTSVSSIPSNNNNNDSNDSSSSNNSEIMKLELIEPTSNGSAPGDVITLPIEHQVSTSNIVSKDGSIPTTTTIISKDVWTKISSSLKINSDRMFCFDDLVLTSSCSKSLFSSSTLANTSIQ